MVPETWPRGGTGAPGLLQEDAYHPYMLTGLQGELQKLAQTDVGFPLGEESSFVTQRLRRTCCKPRESLHSEMFPMLSAFLSTDTGPLPFERGRLRPCYRDGCVGGNVVGMHQPYDLDCVPHTNTCDNRARTMAVGRCSLQEGVIRELGYERTLGMTIRAEPGGRGSHEIVPLSAHEHTARSEESALF